MTAESTRQPVPSSRSAIIGLCLLTATCYLGVLRAGFVYDDDWTIQHNSTIRSLGNIPALLSGELVRQGRPDAWRPLMVISHMLDFQLFGLRPLGYHLHSLGWHLGCVLLVWLLARRLTGRPLLALTSAALFAAHPIHVEAVAAINYREDLLATFFGLAALLVALKGISPVAGEVRRSHWRAPAAALLLLLAGLAAKASAVVVPLLYVVSVWLCDARPRLRRALPGAVALGGAAVAYLGWRLHASGGISPYSADLRQLPWPSYLEGALRTVAQLVLPLGLSPEYVQPARPWLSPPGLAALLGLMAILVVALWSVRKGATVEAVGLLWLLLAWVPTSGIIDMPNARADRYAYLPSVGWCLVAAALLGRLSRPALRLSATALVLGAYTVVSVFQVGVWRSDMTVWRRSVSVAPTSGRAWTGLARAQAAAGDHRAAARSAKRGLSLSPASGTAHLVLANIRAREGSFAEAFEHYARAARLQVRHPGQLYTSWGWALFLAGRKTEAEAKLRQAIARSPGLAEAYANLAHVLARAGRTAEARAALSRALELAPERRAQWRLPRPVQRTRQSP